MTLTDAVNTAYSDSIKYYDCLAKTDIPRDYPDYQNSVRIYFYFGFITGYRADYTTKNELMNFNKRLIEKNQEQIARFTFEPYIDGYARGLIYRTQEMIQDEDEQMKGYEDTESTEPNCDNYSDLLNKLFDSANGKLPDCFKRLASLIKIHLLHETQVTWLLESIKTVIEEEIDLMKKI